MLFMKLVLEYILKKEEKNANGKNENNNYNRNHLYQKYVLHLPVEHGGDGGGWDTKGGPNAS